MKISKQISYVTASLIAATTLSPLAVSAQVVGVNAAVKNKVQTRKVNTRTLVPAKLKDRVRIGDFITTGPRGVLQILLRDRTSFTVGKKGRVTIDRFVYDPASNASEVAASVTKGAFRFVSGKGTRKRKGRSSVRTPVGSIGIRGTIFEGAVGEDAVTIARQENIPEAIVSESDEDATLVVLRGPGINTQGDEISGAVDLRAGDTVYPLEQAGTAYFVPKKNGTVFGPFPISDKGLVILQDLLRTEPDEVSPRLVEVPKPPRVPSVDQILEVPDNNNFFDPLGVTADPGGVLP